MRIEGGYRARMGGKVQGTSSGSGGVFQLEAGQGRETAAASAPAATPTIDSLLALQSVEDPLLARRKAIRRGTALLDALEGIRADLLTGRVGEGRLNGLIALVGTVRERAEPALDSLLDDIELRARVELAKLGRILAA